MDRPSVQALYTKRLEQYHAFIRFFQSRRGFRKLLEERVALKPGLRVLDAGCGSGMASFALIDALRCEGLDYERIDAFDVTPAMLSRFGKELDSRRLQRVRLNQADVLELEALPDSWTAYDLILATSMLEYLPKADLPRALAALHERLAAGGCILAMITRRSIETKVFIEWAWGAERYTADELRAAFEKAGYQDLRFIRFPLPFVWLSRANYVLAAS
jgi:SAM-dependent methyltransferase